MAAMATFSAFTIVTALPRSTPRHTHVSFFPPALRALRSVESFKHLALSRDCSDWARRMRRVASAEEEAAQVAEEQPAVAVPISPSYTLSMFFEAEGMMNESDIPTVSKALEADYDIQTFLQETEGLSNLKVQVVEGMATVELRKETTVQATGVASNLVEAIQGAGFRLQTLNLSFADEEEILV